MRGKAPRTDEDRAFDKQVGARIKAFRLASGQNQTQVAQAAGVTFQQLQKYEKGLNRVAASRLATIARALNVSMSQLLEEGEAPPTDVTPVNGEIHGLVDAYRNCTPSARAAVLGLTRALARSSAK